MDTRRTLENEFHTAREGSTPSDGTPTIVIGGHTRTVNTASRKRRLTSGSIGSMMSIGDDPTVAIQQGDLARDWRTRSSPEGRDWQRMLEENERLRFELENAKSLQEVLENNMTSLRDQLVRAKLSRGRPTSEAPGTDADERPDRIDRDSDLGLVDVSERAPKAFDVEKEGSVDYRAAREDLNKALEELEAARDTISRLELGLSTARASQNATDQQNESLRAALEASQTNAEREASEKHELRTRIAELEGQAELTAATATNTKDGDHGETNATFETTLELQMLANKLSKSQQSLIDTTKSLEDARSKVRRLEQAIETQDAEHLSYVQAKDELAGWKTIFKHLNANPTPDVLVRHIHELESKLERAETQIASSPRGNRRDDRHDEGGNAAVRIDDTSERLAALENNVVSLEQENLQLHQRVKSLNTALDAAENANARLAHKLGNGAFNPETTKVVHMKRNPFTDAKLAQMQVELDTLRGENQVLKNSVGGVSRAKSSTEELAMLATTQGRLTATEKKLANSEKSNQRLQQIFSQQISTFRESIALLFGWQLDMTSDPTNKKERARLSLTLSGQKQKGAKQKRLVFRMVEGGTDPAGGDGGDRGGRSGGSGTSLILVDTPFSKKHQKTVDTCINAMGSVPLFVANLTLDDIQARDT